MPLQTYRCAAGHEFDMHVRIDLSNEPVTCPMRANPDDPQSECFCTVARQFPVPSRSFPGADSWRR